MADRCFRFIVSGRVQGVFFRQHTYDVATHLSLRGYVRNLKDGRVEVVACGDSEALEELETWLNQGSPAAKVEGVIKESHPLGTFDCFEVIRKE